MADKDLYLEKINGWAELLIQSKEGYFLVEAKMLPGNRIKLFVDADEGASIGELARMNKTLRKQIDEEELFPDGDYSLEVSSPGLDEPLKQWRQYKKNVGREVELVLANGQKKKGILAEVTDDFITLEYKLKNKKGKQKKEDPSEKEPEQFPFEKIKITKVCVGF